MEANSLYSLSPNEDVTILNLRSKLLVSVPDVCEPASPRLVNRCRLPPLSIYVLYVYIYIYT